MADSSSNCVQCGRSSDLVCKKCKTQVYCSDECQIQHWRVHKPQCKRRELASAACDVCGDTEELIASCCFECGFIFCQSCYDHVNCHDETSRAAVDSSEPSCPGCDKSLEYQPTDIEKLLKIVQENNNDPRLAQWLVTLGCFCDLESEDGEQNAIKYFKRAGKRGLGEGYWRLAEIYRHKQNWTEAKRYYRKAADLHDVVAIHEMGYEAYTGFIDPQQEPIRDPNFEEAYRWFQAGAQLGGAQCCTYLGFCYEKGIGTEENLVKAFKWVKRAAEMGNAAGMRRCGEYYQFGKGVEQSNERAIYWYEKALEVEDNEEIQDRIQDLRRLL